MLKYGVGMLGLSKEETLSMNLYDYAELVDSRLLWEFEKQDNEWKSIEMALFSMSKGFSYLIAILYGFFRKKADIEEIRKSIFETSEDRKKGTSENKVEQAKKEKERLRKFRTKSKKQKG